MRRALPFAAVLLLYCGGPGLGAGGGVSCGGSRAEPARVAPRVAASVAPRSSTPLRCSATAGADAREVLARHARAYGSPEAVAASLPVAMTGTLSLEDAVGTTEIVVTREAARSQAWIGGIATASGVDASGAWTLAGGTGVVERLSAVEGVGPALESWLLRRSYVTSFDAARDTSRCEDLGGEPARGSRVDVAFARPELGAPVLSFDLESGALLSVAHQRADGSTTRTTFEAWSEAEHGVRWPRKSTTHPLASSKSTEEYRAIAHALECARFDATGVSIPEQGVSCVSPPRDRFVLQWPAGDRPRVRVPLVYVGNELVVRAKVGARDALAFLDSGANATAVDATTPAGKEFRPSMEVNGSGATQKLRLGFGELAAVDLGELRAEHIPTVSVPIPGLDVFGDKRPEVILGYSFFAKAVIRVDYKRLEVIFARSSDDLFAKGAHTRSVPLRVLDSKLIADGSVEGAPAPFEVDTGNSGGLDLYKKWASAHDLPGSRPVVTIKGRFGAGTAETTSTFFRIAKAALGPIAFDGQLTNVADPPAPGIVAGLAGNQVLARCDAVIFDVPKRTLWLEGSCDRAVPENRAGWRFDKKVDPAQPDRPWVIGSLWPGGAAERAGVQVGDRVLEVGGKPATLEVAPLWALEQQAVGTKLSVVVTRAAAPKDRVRLIIELRSPPP